VKKHVILQKTLPNQSFINLERVGPGEKGCHLLATARKGFGRYFREAHFLGSCTNWILSLYRREKKERGKGKRERALKSGRRTPAAPSHDVGEPCIMSWPHYLSTTICPLLLVSPSRSSYLFFFLSFSLLLHSSSYSFHSLISTHSLFYLCVARRCVYTSVYA